MIRIQNDVQFENPINLLAWCCQHVTIVSYICCRNNCDGKFAECKTLKNLGLDEYDLIFISWIQVYVIVSMNIQGRRNRWSNCFTGIQRFYYREIFSILDVWKGKIFVLHRKRARAAAPAKIYNQYMYFWVGNSFCLIYLFRWVCTGDPCLT